MDLLKTLFHFIMMWFGATIRLDSIKYPNLLMLINRVVFIAFLIYKII
jgi:hypothetical protein